MGFEVFHQHMFNVRSHNKCEFTERNTKGLTNSFFHIVSPVDVLLGRHVGEERLRDESK